MHKKRFREKVRSNYTTSCSVWHLLKLSFLFRFRQSTIFTTHPSVSYRNIATHEILIPNQHSEFPKVASSTSGSIPQKSEASISLLIALRCPTYHLSSSIFPRRVSVTYLINSCPLRQGFNTLGNCPLVISGIHHPHCP